MNIISLNYVDESVRKTEQLKEHLKQNGWNPKNYRYKHWDIILNQQKEIKEYVISCEQCGIDYMIYANIERGFSDKETVTCEKCNQNLGDIRADWGFIVIATRKSK